MKPKYFFILTVLALWVGACAPATPPAVAPTQAATEPASNGYSVNINPDDFVAVVDNPYFPHIPGSKFVYEGQTREGLERVEIIVLEETKVVMGVTTTIMRDTVYLDGQIKEDTYDWLAQDKEGNVWYFGEDVNDYENGVVVDRDGTWLAGKDGPPAMIMPANPQVGNIYRVENIPGNVFEEVTVQAINQTLEGPRGLIKGVR